ncbi:MAG: oxidoreductase [Pseudomonadota bacterium]
MNATNSDQPSPHPHLVLGKPLQLPCGAILKNRVAKSAMSDSLGDGAGNPTGAQMRLYERWAQGGAAVSMIGEVQGDPRYPEKPGNLVFGPQSDLEAIRSLARRGTASAAHLWPQLGHAGALSHLPISQPKGPSALDVEGLSCAALSVEEIEALPSTYARAAALAKQAGFTGVHIHAGHGFLLSQFLSPLFNRRTDAYGGPVEARCRIVLEIVAAVRRAVGPSYPIGIRINATDKLEGGLAETDALEVVRLLDSSTVDLIDISGGTYFPGAKASSDGVSDSGPYFLDFSRRAKQATSVPVMLTGGFERRDQAAGAVASGAADMVGLARAMVLNPGVADAWLQPMGGDPDFPVFDNPPRGGVTAWYSMRLTALGEDREAIFAPTPDAALEAYEQRDEERCEIWRKAFSSAPTA